MTTSFRALRLIGILLLLVSIPGVGQETDFTEDFEAKISHQWELEAGWKRLEEEGNAFLNGEGHSWARLHVGGEQAVRTLRFRLRLVRGGIHLNYRVSDAGRYLIGFRAEELYLSKEAPWGHFSDLSRREGQFDPGLWHDVALIAEAGSLRVFVDGTLAMDYEDETPLTRGIIGFETLEDALVSIDDVEVGFEGDDVSLQTPHAIDLDLTNLLAFRQEGLQLVSGEASQELLSAAEGDLNEALRLAERKAVSEAEARLQEAEGAYREAILAGLRQGLFRQAERDLEEGKGDITPERLDRARVFLEQAQDKNVDAQRFLDLVQRIKRVLIAGQAFPDLTVELWSVPPGQMQWSHMQWLSPYPPVKDQLTIVSAVVKNIGLVPVDKPFDTALYVDGKRLKTWRFSPLLEAEDIHHQKDPLMPGETEVVQFAHTLAAGSHSFHWKVDAKNEVSESDESKKSNELEATALWHAPSDLPDLIVEDLFTDDPLVVGQETTWKVRIKNKGKTDVLLPFITILKVSGGAQIGAFWLDALAAGEAKVVETKQQTTLPGSETLTATVDAGNVIPETDETNNQKAKPFTIAYVDLEVLGNLSVEPATPVIHKPVKLAFSVKNNGPGVASKPFKIWVYPGQVTSGLTQPVKLTVPIDKLPLKAGDSVNLQHEVWLSHPGTYQMGVMADFPDPDVVYQEKDKANNTRTFSFHLKETYYIKISRVEYDFCQTGARIHLDRSGGYWKGDVKIKYGWKETAIPANQTTSGWIGTFGEPGVTYWLEPYAVVGDKLIPSSAPKDNYLFFFHHTDKVEITSMAPKILLKGKKTPVTIKGKQLAGFANDRPTVWVKDEHIDVTVTNFYYDRIDATLDVKPDAYAGSAGHYLHVDSDCQGSDKARFTVTKGDTQPTPVQKPDLLAANVDTDPDWPAAGEKFTVKFFVLNTGNAEAGASEAKLLLDGGTQSKTVKVGKLKPGTPFVIPWDFSSGLPKGDHTFELYLDHKKEVAELNENNNYTAMGKKIGL